MAVGRTGNVYVGGTLNERIGTAAFSRAGTNLWSHGYALMDYGWGGVIAIDSQEDVFVTGGDFYHSNPHPYPPSYTVSTVKYNRLGSELWATYYADAFSVSQSSSATDDVGNYYVCAAAPSPEVIKYTSGGNAAWSRPSPGNGRVLVTTGSNVYVAGSSLSDYLAFHYNKYGDLLDSIRFNGPLNGTDDCLDIAVGGDGCTYLTGYGYSRPGPNCNYDLTTLKYGPTDSLLWIARCPGPSAYSSQKAFVKLDADGGVIVAGTTYADSSGLDYVTLKYSTDGEELWRTCYSGPQREDDVLACLAVDRTGNSYVTGSSESCFATVKYGPDGHQGWAALYRYPGSTSCHATCIETDSCGSGVYVVGYSSQDSWVTLRYTQDAAIHEDQGGLRVESVTAEPDPFLSSTSIVYTLSGAAQVGVSVFDVTGCLVRSFPKTRRNAGRHEVRWDGTDDRGSAVPPGVYVVSVGRPEVGSSCRVLKLSGRCRRR